MSWKFWKKDEDDFDDGPDFSSVPPSTPGDMPPPAREPSVSSYKEPSPPSFMQEPARTTPATHDTLDKDMQLLNAKLDAIKATLDIIVQRLDKQERTQPPKW